MNVLFRLSLTDVTTGFRLIRRDVFNALQLRSSGFSIETELTARLALAGAKLVEVPISYVGRSKADGKKLTAMHGIYTAWHAVRMWIASRPFAIVRFVRGISELQP